MARLESICFTPQRCLLSDQGVEWSPVTTGKAIVGLPQIFWKEGTPWNEANQWLYERMTSGGVSIRTVTAVGSSIHAYAEWLEKTSTDWWDFPVRKADRCLVRFRGALVAARDQGVIAPSTAQHRMNAVINFYRWLRNRDLLSPDWPMWRERTIGIRIYDSVGFERTIAVNTTDLSLRNRTAPGERLEDGLTPLSGPDRDKLLRFARETCSEELFLMLTLGFFTGMRVGTLADLRVQTLENAVPDPAAPNLFRIAVGPGADPPVSTKLGVTGQILITRPHLEQLRGYAYSVRRLKRELLAGPENKSIVFLTRFGNPYAQRGSDKSSAINVEMHNLRKRALTNGLGFIRGFRFHQSRCTFATELAQIAINAGHPENAVALVKEALLHRHEQTSLKYIKFVKKIPAKRELANDFTRAFLGLYQEQERAVSA